MVKIILDGNVVSTSKNLRGILRYDTNHLIEHANAMRLPSGGVLTVVWSNGANCEIKFESYYVLCNWLNSRRKWAGYRTTDENPNF